MDPVAFLDGQPAPELATSAAYLHGVTCFETIALDGGELAHLGAHLDRLAEGLDTLALSPPGGLGGIRKRLDDAVAAYGGTEGIARVSVHATGPLQGLHLEDPSASVLVVVQPARYPDLADGVAAVAATRRAPDPEAFPTGFKTPCLPRLLAHREARERGAFEALMLDARGHVVSGTRSNVFAAIEGTLTTPPTPPALPGVTRQRVLDAAEAAGLEAEIRRLHRDELPEADELFITFTGPGIVPIVRLDGAPIAGGRPGPIAGKLADQV